MKVCKKCKKQVTNKSKICKYCGADVSKSKIIKNNNVNKTIGNIPEKKEVEIKEKAVIEEVKKKNKKLPIKNETEAKTINKKKNIVKSKKQIPKENKKSSIVKPLKQIKKDNEKEVNIINNKLKKNTTAEKDLKKKTQKISNLLVFKQLKSAFTLIWKRVISFKMFKDRKWRKLFIILVFLLAIGIIIYGGLQVYRNFINSDNAIIVTEKATNNKVFGMGDVITYKNVNYEVVNVETSEGNNYKSPKDGNIFLIITVLIKNNDSNRIEYSYENWTMSNSEGSESKRIFSSINVDTALYSGDLVIGGIKKGSMVFEQPKDDKDLRLNFYELKTNKKGEHYINLNKKIFSVSIKIPEKKENVKTNNKIVNNSNE